MSQENVEIVQAAFEATQRGDWERALCVFHPDVVLDQTRMPDGGTYHGVEGVRDFYARWFGAWDGLQIDAERVIDAGERVVLLHRLRGRGRGTGAKVSMLAADVLTLQGGKIVRHDGYPDAQEALTDLGLAE